MVYKVKSFFVNNFDKETLNCELPANAIQMSFRQLEPNCVGMQKYFFGAVWIFLKMTEDQEPNEKYGCCGGEFRLSNFGLDFPKPELFVTSQVSISLPVFSTCYFIRSWNFAFLSGVCSFCWNFDIFLVNSQKVGVQMPENIEVKNWFPTWHSVHFWSLFTCRYFTRLSQSSSPSSSKCSAFLKIDL